MEGGKHSSFPSGVLLKTRELLRFGAQKPRRQPEDALEDQPQDHQGKRQNLHDGRTDETHQHGKKHAADHGPAQARCQISALPPVQGEQQDRRRCHDNHKDPVHPIQSGALIHGR